jgi:hypothetical protein
MRECGQRPTLGELQQTMPWVCFWCERCQNHARLRNRGHLVMPQAMVAGRAFGAG